jgi:hypothetical protein
MAEMAGVMAAIGNQSNAKANGGPDPNRVSQWSRVLFAEILSFFVPSPTIDNDPLLLNL